MEIIVLQKVIVKDSLLIPEILTDGMQYLMELHKQTEHLRKYIEFLFAFMTMEPQYGSGIVYKLKNNVGKPRGTRCRRSAR